MSAQHTPGPWELDCSGLGAWIMAGGPDGLHVATIPIARDGDWSDANARLIAAAPDMLAALKHILAADEAAMKELAKMGSDQFDTSHGSSIGLARAAIAKAEGR